MRVRARVKLLKIVGNPPYMSFLADFRAKSVVFRSFLQFLVAIFVGRDVVVKFCAKNTKSGGIFPLYEFSGLKSYEKHHYLHVIGPISCYFWEFYA